jgi:hypothetical protein
MNPTAGTMPWVPSWCRGLVAPIPAQRLAAWRVIVGLVLLFDILFFYMPMSGGQLYGPDSLAGPGVFVERFQWPFWNWSLLEPLPAAWGAQVCLAIWIASALLLTLGWLPHLAALIAWALSLSFYNSNFYLHNSGDRLRHFILLLLIVAPAAHAWTSRWRPRREPAPLVSGWPMRVMLLQMTVMYFMNGWYKLQGRMWWEGSVMWYVNHDLAWARWSAIDLPYRFTQVLTWAALIWEVGFPLWILWKRTRVAALVFGVVFHTITFFHLELAAFPLYALCLYVPLAPWERLSRTKKT